jgi:formate hydrogenlyase subunit 3/multisubunit Na+/H+ antiporter MnhD subunit
MSALALLLGCDAALLALGLAAIAVAKSRAGSAVVYGFAFALCSTLIAGGAYQLLGGHEPETLALPIGLPWIGANFRLDALSAFFVTVVNLGAAAASVYGLGYGAHERDPERVLPFYPAFLAGMNIVLLADDAYTFLLSWEFMSLTSWALVMAHHREAGNQRAGYVYILMASFGTMALLLAFGLLAGANGAYLFQAMREASPTAGVAALALMLALAGAGSKAGLAPLHVWLPLAHPAAPSHVSALMSGVMTKVAVYGFIRIVFDLAGPADWRWSVPVLAVGAITGLLGVLHALVQSDLKRVLAFSTIENIGLIFVALGLALAFKASGLGGAAALAMTAALFHTFNHAAFKSLLFLGAGAVLSATGERRMDRLGGLLNRMPATGFFMLVGCAAIAALPPLNGFVSEWMMLQAILLGPQFPQWTLKLLAPAVGAVIALVAALAAACFVRAFGIPFLGRPRSPEAAAALEVDRFSLAAMGALALLCFLAGIFPGAAIDALKPVTLATIGASMPTQATIPWLSIAPIAESRSSYNGLLVLIFIVASASLAASAIHRFASAALRRASAWDCGFPEASPETQYSAESFSQPIRRVFGRYVFGGMESLDMPAPGEMRPASYHFALRDPIWDAIYLPIVSVVSSLAIRLNRLQFLTIRQYLSVVFAALVALLLLLAAWP